MKYLYDTNMQLITIVKDLQSKYDIVAKNHNESNLINNDLKTELQSVETKIKTISEENKILKEKSSIIENFDNKIVNNLENKISKLEQNAVNNYIIMQGHKVNEIISQSEINNEDVKLKIKEYLASIFDQNDKYLIDDIGDVKIYGRNLKFLRLQLSSAINKKKFIIGIKTLRPDQIFVSEFLVLLRLKLFHQLRLFAKENKDKIEQVFTRNGNIFYKDAKTKQISFVSSSDDISNL